MKTAYITLYINRKTKERKMNFTWTLEEAKKNLSKKDFELLTSFNGISKSYLIGYVA